MRVLTAFFTSPIPYLVLIGLGLILIALDTSRASWLVVSGTIGAALGLLAMMSATRRKQVEQPERRGDTELSGAGQAIALASGTIFGFAAILVLGMLGALVGALIAAATAASIPILAPDTQLVNGKNDGARIWVQVLTLSSIVGATLVVFASQI